MEPKLIRIEHDIPGIATIILNRPEKRNALSIALMQALCTAFEAAAGEPGARVIILRGAGPVFCAGLDLHEAAQSEGPGPAVEWVGRLMEAVYGSPLVTIAAAQGAAIGGGAGLMSACDFVVASEDLRVGYPEIHRGLMAAVVMTFLRRQLRERDARELLLLGELIDARRALAIGLVNRVVPANTLMDEARRLAALAMKGAPLTAARTKRLLDELWPHSVSEDVELALKHHLAARGSDEAREGIAAFLEKRPPGWTPPST